VALSWANLTVKQGGFSGTSPQTLTSATITVTPGARVIVGVDAEAAAGVVTTIAVSDSSSLTWTARAAAINTGNQTTQVFSAIAGATTSITISVELSTPTNSTNVSGAFTVDQVSGQGADTSNYIWETANYTATPGGTLPSAPVSTSSVYAFYCGQANSPTGGGTLTAPSGFTSLEYSSAPSTSNDIDGIASAYKTGSTSQTNDWSHGVIQSQQVLFWEIPIGSSSITKVAATGRIVIRGALGGTAIVLGTTPGRIVLRGVAPRYSVSSPGSNSGEFFAFF